MNAKPLLLPKHFVVGSACRLTKSGLQYHAELPDVTPLRIVLNPPRPTATNLGRQLKADQARVFTYDKMNVTYELPERYDRRWSRSGYGDDDVEEQKLVLVAFYPKRAVGYASLTAQLSHWEGTHLLLTFSLHMVYIKPRYRGKGIGTCLSLACGEVCGDIFAAVCRAAPEGITICPTIYADYESKGGEMFAVQVFDSVDAIHQRMQSRCLEDGLTLEPLLLDAGY